MFPFIIIATIQGTVGAAIAQEAARRAKLGLPPLKIEEASKSDRSGEVMLWLWFVIGGVIFTTPFAALMYAVIKLGFAMQGVEF